MVFSAPMIGALKWYAETSGTGGSEVGLCRFYLALQLDVDA